jgi:serine phosphatase RsbU (regulator of sigma subunit)
MISGVDDPELGAAALENGAYAYHVKPVGATQLYLLVVNNLRRRSLEIEHRASLDRLEAMVEERSEQMRRAAELQAGMLPRSPLKEADFEVAAHLTAAREISGDFYDWYRSSNGRMVVTLGDVMGKGLQASLMMATARAALRGVAGVEPLEAGIKQAASVMSAALEVNHSYVTLFHCTFDTRSGELEYVDAGHGHARVLRGVTSQELLGERSAPVGIFPDTRFLTGKVTLERGDSLVVFSDGLLDLRPDLGTKDVQLPYEARRAQAAQDMVDILAQGARDKTLSDDVTVVALKRL